MARTKGQLALEGRPTAQVIADYLREQIVQGSIQPGQQINESFMASQLNTSRGPLREALQRLCQEGILISRRNYGVFVLEVETEDIREIYEVRETVESAAANILLDGSAEQLRDTCNVLGEIVGEMARQAAVPDWRAIARLDMQFHSSLVAGTRNSRFIRIYQTLAAESRMCIHYLEASYPRVDVLVKEHQDILDLLEAGDRIGLVNALKWHMRNAVQDITATRQGTALNGPNIRTLQ